MCLVSTRIRSNTPYWITQSTTYSIDKVIFEQNYIVAKYNNLALIKTHQPIIFETVTPIVVPDQTNLEMNTQVVGWQTDHLYKLLTIKIYAIENCSVYLNKVNTTTSSSICVSKAQPRKSLKCILHQGAALITDRKILGFSHSNVIYDRGHVYGMFINVSMCVSEAKKAKYNTTSKDQDSEDANTSMQMNSGAIGSGGETANNFSENSKLYEQYKHEILNTSFHAQASNSSSDSNNNNKHILQIEK
ncbi:hypothetical protein RN001_007494 [Aquatica leii]|uniref:Uncharacterized protein n=1 Tax=Aquatica leii TaxID=1421715 RepID=A0AAN7QIC5_9COLE|nr:hypothetical protein RN001_007494 [Aquatica leii]